MQAAPLRGSWRSRGAATKKEGLRDVGCARIRPVRCPSCHRLACEASPGLLEHEGALAFALEDHSIHKSPSAAASKVMNGASVNGRRFWSLEGGLPAKAPKAEKAPKAKTGAAKHAAPLSNDCVGGRRKHEDQFVVALSELNWLRATTAAAGIHRESAGKRRP